MAGRIVGSGQILDIFPVKCSMRMKEWSKLTPWFLFWTKVNLNLSLITEKGRTTGEVGGLGGVQWGYISQVGLNP